MRWFDRYGEIGGRRKAADRNRARKERRRSIAGRCLVCRLSACHLARAMGYIPFVAGGLELMWENCALGRRFTQVNSIILESCRLFSEVRAGAVSRKIASGTDCSTSDYSPKAFPQVKGAVGRYRQLLQARGGTAVGPPLVPRWYCDFALFPNMENNGNPRSWPGSVLRTALFFIIEWE